MMDLLIIERTTNMVKNKKTFLNEVVYAHTRPIPRVGSIYNDNGITRLCFKKQDFGPEGDSYAGRAKRTDYLFIELEKDKHEYELRPNVDYCEVSSDWNPEYHDCWFWKSVCIGTVDFYEQIRNGNSSRIVIESIKSTIL